MTVLGSSPDLRRQLVAPLPSWLFTLGALAFIVLAGALLRFRGLDWDHAPGASTRHMHPDERFITIVANDIDWPSGPGEYFDTGTSPLNPYNTQGVNSFVYGTLPLYAGKALATWAGDDPAGPGNSYDELTVWGRRLTAAVSTATIPLVFLLGFLLFGRVVGLLGALLWALAVLPTQLAHFWTADPYVTFFGTATVALSVLLVREWHPGVRWPLYALLGLAIGLGMASKVAFWPFILAPVLETGARMLVRDMPGAGWRHRLLPSPPNGSSPRSDWMTDLAGLFLAALVSIVVFRVAQPNAFVGPGFLDLGINTQWWNDLRSEGDRQSGTNDYPPFVQFAGRLPYVEPLVNMVLWGMGPALGLAAWGAVVAGGVTMARRRDLAFLTPVALSLLFLAYFGGRFVVFMRYFDSAYPLLCVLAGWGIVSATRASLRHGAPHRIRDFAARQGVDADAVVRVMVPGFALLAVAATAWWALAFQNVYTNEHPRLQASRWIFENVPPGRVLTTEIWDDSLPYDIPGYPFPGVYALAETEPYEPDSPDKISRLIYGVPGDARRPGLIGADYVVISSDRIRASVPRLEREYPATIRYYELLDSGDLGFELAASFQVRPSFLGIAIDDSSAEESFTVYDHPIVRIYRKTGGWDARRAFDLLMEAYPDRAVNLLPAQGRTNGLQFTPAEAAKQQAGGTFSEVFDEDGPATRHPVLWWFAWLELAALAAVPFAVVVFARLPDRGYALTKLLGPLAVALATWLMVAWDVVDFSGSLASAMFVGWLVAGAFAAVLLRRRIAAAAREHWRSWLAAEALFLGVFLFFVGIRLLNPDTWHHPQGGEKPMELAYLTAVVRSTEMPPYDPWFAGGSMNYYYWGWFFLAVPIRALRMVPEVAFNLGVPTFAAIAASVAYSTAYNLAALSRRVMGMSGGRRPPLAAGLLGAFFLAFAGNFDGLHQSVERLQRINTWGLFEGVPVVGGAVGIVGGLVRWAGGTGLPAYDWWRSSRVHIGSFDITEFPYWSFVFADLHPHLMGLAFLGLVVGLSLACVLAASEGDTRRSLVFAAALGLAAALVRAVHTWDYPTAVLVALAGIAGGQLLAPGPPARRLLHGGAQVLLFALLFVLPMAPYAERSEVFNQGVIRAPERTPLNQWIAQFGVFGIVALAYVIVAYAVVARSIPVESGPVRRLLARPGPAGALIALGLALGIAGIAWQDRYATVGVSAVMLVILANLLWWQWRREPRDPGALFITALLFGGFAIGAGVDLVTVKGDIVRMNTVFKFSLQAWQLLAIACAGGAWYALTNLDALRAGSAPALPRRWEALAGGALAALLLVSAIFMWSGTRARIDARFPGDRDGLDGLAYLRTATYFEDGGNQDPTDDRTLVLADDEPLIRWLRDNVRGSPVIVEAVGPLYHWTGRISMNTGLPAVIGWDWHQIQQRWTYSHLISQRRFDTEQFYRGDDVASAEAYLRKYDVSYVVVGTEELVYGSPRGIQRLGEVPALVEVFRSGEYAIYRVDRSRLPAPAPSPAFSR